MSESEFICELEKIGIVLNDKQREAFRVYAEFLSEYNQHTNLTSIKYIDDIYLKHFYDSILACKFFDFGNKRVLDIGTGAGFPGVPLKIVDDSIELVLLDSNGKKTKFLEELRHKLNLEYTVINDRAEQYNVKERENFDVVVSRAVASLNVLSEIGVPFVRVGGMMIAYKAHIEDEIEDGEYAVSVLGGSIVKCEKCDLPKNAGMRTFVLIEKKCQTKCDYPRLFDKIAKKPLQKR